MTPKQRRRSSHSHTAILDATVDQLTSVGYQRMTIEGIAAAAGVGKATVYRWWPTKVRLAVEALSTRSEVKPIVTTGDLRDDVRALVQRGIEIMTKAPLGRALPQLCADMAGDPQARAALGDWLGPTRVSHVAMLYEAAGRGDLPYDLDANLILDLVAGTVMFRELLSQRIDDELVEQLTTLIVDRQLPRAPEGDRLV